MILLSSADFFSNITFSKILSRNYTIRVSNSLDTDQDRHSVCPDLGPNCLQRLSADDKSPPARKELNNQGISICVGIHNKETVINKTQPSTSLYILIFIQYYNR